MSRKTGQRRLTSNPELMLFGGDNGGEENVDEVARTFDGVRRRSRRTTLGYVIEFSGGLRARYHRTIEYI